MKNDMLIVMRWIGRRAGWLWKFISLSDLEHEAKYAGWVARFTFVLCLVGLIQGWAILTGDRAFVFPDRIEFLDKLNSVGDTPRISLGLSLKNSGKGIAKIENLVVSVSHELGPVPAYDVNKERFAFSPVPAGVSIEQTFGFGLWSRETMLKVKNGELRFYVFGKIEYSDDSIPLMPDRISQFCFRYIPEQPDIGGSRFSNCPEPAYTYTK